MVSVLVPIMLIAGRGCVSSREGEPREKIARWETSNLPRQVRPPCWPQMRAATGPGVASLQLVE